MCGIAGEIACQSRPIFDNWVRAACRLMAHRGPDGEGYYLDSGVAFGHRRLAVIDVQGGAQPLSYDQQRYWITYNGEIYNYRELREELIGKGYAFVTRSDTEVILAAYSAWGVDCLSRLNGIFAFGLWDSRERSLLLARDPLGVKPLLYYADQITLCFASEIKALLAHGSIEHQVDSHALQDYVALGYVLSPKTIIKNVFKLPAGHYLLAREGRREIRPYWRLDEIVQSARHGWPSERDCFTEFDTRLRQAIESQMVSDVPLGAFLSGGIDSSTVAYYASPARGSLETFSMGFEETTFSELSYADQVSRHLGTIHRDRIVRAPSLDQLAKLIWYYDEPIGDTSIIPTFYLAELARENVVVALSGDGGDELLAGYDTYVADRLYSYYQYLPISLRHKLAHLAVQAMPVTYGKVPLSLKITRFMTHASASPEQAHYSWRMMFDEEESTALTGGLRSDTYSPFSVFAAHYADVAAADPLHRALYVDIKTWLVDDLLTKVDRASMACSLETRVPLLAPDFVAYAMRIPAELKLRGLNRKYILKRIMRHRLPRAILRRRKRGFNAPISIWMRTSLAKEIEELLSTSASSVVDLKHPLVRQLWREHVTGRADHGFKLWTLLSLILWEKRVLS